MVKFSFLVTDTVRFGSSSFYARTKKDITEDKAIV